MTEIFLNPYVIQMDKFADSLIHLSRTFLSLESYKGTFSKEEFEEMFVRITDQVCGECEKRKRCLQENRVYTYQLSARPGSCGRLWKFLRAPSRYCCGTTRSPRAGRGMRAS